MRIYPPRKTYILPVVFLVFLRVSFWMLEQAASSSEYWANFPFGWLTWIAVAFMAGLFVQDLYNEDSWVRKTIRSYFQVFTIEVLTTPHKTTPDHEWLEILLRVRIIKNVNNATIVLRAHSCMNIAHAREDFILEKKKIETLAKDELLNFTLGALPLKSYNNKPSIYQAWGNKRESGDTDGMVSLHSGSENLVEIEVQSGRFRQTEVVFIAVLQTEGQSFGKVFLAREASPMSLAVIPKYED